MGTSISESKNKSPGSQPGPLKSNHLNQYKYMETEVQVQETPLSKIIQESGLEKTKAEVLKEKFDSFFDLAAEWSRKANALEVTSITQVTEMKMADEARKMLKAKRVDIEKTRKSLKEDSLREGKTIDAIATILTNLIEPIERDLEQKAKFKEIFEANKKAELRTERLTLLAPFGVFIENGYSLGDMDEVMFQSLLGGVKKAHEDKIEADRMAEEARLKAIEEEQKRVSEIEATNVRLRKESEEKAA